VLSSKDPIFKKRERTSSESFLKISTPRAGSQTRPNLRCIAIGDESAGELGPAEESAVSFEIERSSPGTDFADGILGCRCTPTDDTVVIELGPFGGEEPFGGVPRFSGLATPGDDLGDRNLGGE